MIFVTVGMSEHNFDRLFKIIDELIAERVITQKVFVQTGNSNYKSKYFESSDIVDNDTFNKMVDECDFMITHAGTGSVVPALKKHKKIIVFPRMEKYNEHIDDHQLELASLFAKEGYILCAFNKDQLIDCINQINNFSPKEFISNNKIENIIIDFIENK